MQRTLPVLPESFVQYFEKIDPDQEVRHLQSEYGLSGGEVEWDRHRELASNLSKEDAELLHHYERMVNGKMDHLHALRISSPDKHRGLHPDEIATLVITNGMTGKDYEIGVWANDWDKGQYQPYYVYLNTPITDAIYVQDAYIDRDRIQPGEVWERIVNDSVSDVRLFDLIEPSEEIEQAIQDYHEKGIAFDLEILPDRLSMDLQEIILNEDVSEILLKAKDGDVTKEDLINFGKNVRGFYQLELNLPYKKEFMESVKGALETEKIEEKDWPFLKETLAAFNVQSNDILSLTKSEAMAKSPWTQELVR